MTRNVRVLIADDHAPTREDLRLALEEDGRFEVCAEASDAAAAVNAAMREQPDLCLIDIRMPGLGIAAAWEISARLPRAKIVMLTVSRDENDFFASLRAGASSYLLKDTDAVALPATLVRVIAGELEIPPTLVARMVEQFRAPRALRRRTLLPLDAGEPLTSREWEVLELLHAGLTTRQIADRLVLSASAVRSHVAAVLRKLRVPDRKAALQLLESQSDPSVRKALRSM